MNTGDLVKIKTKTREYQGILLPRTGLADDTHLVLKLDNGYNIGLPKDSIVSSQIITKAGARPKKKTTKFDKTKSQISIVSTGGTITSTVDYKTGGVFPTESPEELLSKIPELAEHVSIKNMVSPFQMLSEDMTITEWGKIAESVAKELNSGAEEVRESRKRWGKV